MFKLKKKQQEEAVNEEKNNHIEENLEEEKAENSQKSDALDNNSAQKGASGTENDDTLVVKAQSVKSKKKNGEQTVIKWGPNRILQCFAYFAVILIAIAMILRLAFSKSESPQIAEYMQGVGECLAYIVAIWLGFYFTRKRGNIWWLIGWIVATVILVVFYIFAVV